jgi:broad specificity phosphatase PhoE
MGAVYLIRHGQASFGKDNYDQLSDTGMAQATVLGQALHGRLQPDAVFRGSMLRHAQTADGALAAMGSTCVQQIDEGYNEYDHDELIVRLRPMYTNRLLMRADLAKTLNPRKAFQTMISEAITRWMSGRHDTDYRETWPAFQARCTEALIHTIEASGPSKTVLVFTSGGVISAIVQQLLGLSNASCLTLQWTLANAAITKVIYSAQTGARHLSSLNEHVHFEGDNAHLITYR